MYSFGILKLAKNDSDVLDTSTASFLPLIPEKLQKCLWNKNPLDIPDTAVIAIAAHDSNRNPIGIVLASHYLHLRNIHVHYIFVKTPPDLLVGCQLLAELEKEALKQNAKLMSYDYSDNLPETAYMEEILAANGWHEGKPFIVRLHFDGPLFNPPWIHKNVESTIKYRTVLFSSLNPQQIQELRIRSNSGAFPSIINPFYEEERIEPLNSLVLMHEERVVGWSITHRIAPDTIRYTSLYAEHALDFRGYGTLLLMIAGIRLQKKSSVRWAVIELPVNRITSSWTRFVKRRILPYADSVSTIKQSWKQTGTIDV